ncbi:hypothetical protein MMC14_009132 [Varicellaria rhodocarpa]|nr:hypothetical protein [Varicellaria rhodocarpa]
MSSKDNANSTTTTSTDDESWPSQKEALPRQKNEEAAERARQAAILALKEIWVEEKVIPYLQHLLLVYGLPVSE